MTVNTRISSRCRSPLGRRTSPLSSQRKWAPEGRAVVDRTPAHTARAGQSPGKVPHGPYVNG